MTRILLVDDEPPARARLVRLLADLGEHDVAEAGDASEAERVLRDGDLVFLDVTMPGIDGLSFAAHARLPVVVFVTGDASHAARAFDVEAADFLVKPVTRERLARALERAKRRAGLAGAEELGSRIRVLDGERERFLDATRIDHFRADTKYVVFHDGAAEQILRESLDALEPRLPTHARVHRAHLVRLDAIREIDATDDGAFAVLDRDGRVPISRRALAALRARLGR
ncbi:MAG: response regulator transcription factor [Deltaproteobacteria bacterium]|nr:response regulator transcription factor [Deltaproteobacteria bacterium]